MRRGYARLEFPSPLAGEGGLRRRPDEGARRAQDIIDASGLGAPSSVGFADTFSREGRRI
jgi:hypothetical protein